MIGFIIGLLLGASIGVFAYALLVCARERDDIRQETCANCKHSFTEGDGFWLCQNEESQNFTYWSEEGSFCQHWEEDDAP